MKLYIRQKAFSWVDRFKVLDEWEQVRYEVRGDAFALGKRLHVYDMHSDEIACIRQKPWSFRRRFTVELGGSVWAEIVQKFALRQRYIIDGPGWEIEGNFWGHEYSVTAAGRKVAQIRKAWLSWGDSYELDIADPEDELPALAVVLAIDCALAQQAAAAT